MKKLEKYKTMLLYTGQIQFLALNHQEALATWEWKDYKTHPKHWEPACWVLEDPEDDHYYIPFFEEDDDIRRFLQKGRKLRSG